MFSGRQPLHVSCGPSPLELISPLASRPRDDRDPFRNTRQGQSEIDHVVRVGRLCQNQLLVDTEDLHAVVELGLPVLEHRQTFGLDDAVLDINRLHEPLRHIHEVLDLGFPGAHLVGIDLLGHLEERELVRIPHEGRAGSAVGRVGVVQGGSLIRRQLDLCLHVTDLEVDDVVELLQEAVEALHLRLHGLVTDLLVLQPPALSNLEDLLERGTFLPGLTGFCHGGLVTARGLGHPLPHAVDGLLEVAHSLVEGLLIPLAALDECALDPDGIDFDEGLCETPSDRLERVDDGEAQEVREDDHPPQHPRERQTSDQQSQCGQQVLECDDDCTAEEVEETERPRDEHRDHSSSTPSLTTLPE